jgi:hypothetical protein
MSLKTRINKLENGNLASQQTYSREQHAADWEKAFKGVSGPRLVNRAHLRPRQLKEARKPCEAEVLLMRSSIWLIRGKRRHDSHR